MSPADSVLEAKIASNIAHRSAELIKRIPACVLDRSDNDRATAERENYFANQVMDMRRGVADMTAQAKVLKIFSPKD